MATHSAEEIAHEERRYFQIFVLLGVLTVLELGATKMPISHLAIGAILVILAATKAALVALYYMHLAQERTTLTWIALTPAILCVFLVLMLTPDLGAITRMLTHSAPAAPAAHD
jgi:caa(3)-type oxidase subunit IV